MEIRTFPWQIPFKKSTQMVDFPQQRTNSSQIPNGPFFWVPNVRIAEWSKKNFVGWWHRASNVASEYLKLQQNLAKYQQLSENQESRSEINHRLRSSCVNFRDIWVDADRFGEGILVLIVSDVTKVYAG